MSGEGDPGRRLYVDRHLVVIARKARSRRTCSGVEVRIANDDRLLVSLVALNHVRPTAPSRQRFVVCPSRERTTATSAPNSVARMYSTFTLRDFTDRNLPRRVAAVRPLMWTFSSFAIGQCPQRCSLKPDGPGESTCSRARSTPEVAGLDGRASESFSQALPRFKAISHRVGQTVRETCRHGLRG